MTEENGKLMDGFSSGPNTKFMREALERQRESTKKMQEAMLGGLAGGIKPVVTPAPASTSKVLTPAEVSAIRARNASATPAAAPYVAPAHTPARSTSNSNKCDEEKASRNECKR